MQLNDNEHNQLYLGIDGGGSKCKAVIVNHRNEVLGEGISGPANPLHGLEQAMNSIVNSSILAIQDAGFNVSKLKDVIAGIGLAGVNIPVYYDQVSRQTLPFKQSYLTTDLHIACLGAHEGDGAVIIAGTGSCGYSRVNEQELIVGAHGFPQGDKASGAWTGHQAVDRVLKSIDGLEKPTVLTKSILAFLGCKDATEVVTQVAGKNANFYAKMAITVFDAAEAGDEVAVSIIKDGAEYIDGVARKLFAKQPPRFSLIGGLTPRLIPWLSDDVAKRISAPFHPPEMGAIFYAQGLANSQVSEASLTSSPALSII